MTDTIANPAAATPSVTTAGPAPDELDGVDLETWGMGSNNATGITNNKLGMWLFLGSDCLLFGALISTYLLLRHRGTGLGPEDVFDIPYTSVSSFVLLMSSVSMVFAVSSISRGDQQKLRLWLLVTSLLGGTFIAGQVYEFTSFYREGLGYTTNLFSSAFFSLTGFHGVHVTVGIIMLMSLFVMSLTGRLSEERAETVEIVGLYWHFVDIVWVLIFTIVYLIP